MGENFRKIIENNLASGEDDKFLRLVRADGLDSCYSYRTIIEESLRWSNYYRSLGLRPRDRVVIILPHSLELYTSYLGAILAETIPSQFHFPSPKLSKQIYAETIGQLISQSHASLLITYSELKKDLQSILGLRMPRTVSIEEIPAQLSTAWPHIDDQPQTANDSPLFIQYSSGTTGIKKGVGISESQLLWQIKTYAKTLNLTCADCIVSWLPLYHDMGLIACYFLPILTKTKLVAMSPFDWVRRPRMFLEVIQKFNGTLSWLPNFAFNFLAKSVLEEEAASFRLNSLRTLVNCSEPLTIASIDSFLDKFRVAGVSESMIGGAYAMAETTFAISSTSDQHPLRIDFVDRNVLSTSAVASLIPANSPKALAMVGSGGLLPETQVEIVSESGQLLSDRNIGEIRVTSPSLTNGYLTDVSATQASFRDNWFYTGDLGYLSDGHLFVTGRKKDLIIVHGKNIYPHDIEEIAHTVPGVTAGRAVAVGRYNQNLGSEDLVIIAESSIDDSNALNLLRQEIAKVINAATEINVAQVAVVPAGWLKKSTSGKLSRKEILSNFLESEFGKAAVSSSVLIDEGPIELDLGGIRRILQSSLDQNSLKNLNHLTLESKLISSGLIDSLGLVHLIVALENAFKIPIPPEAHLNFEQHFDSIGSIISLIRHIKSGDIQTLIKSEIQTKQPISSLLPVMGERDFKAQQYLNSRREIDLLYLGNSRCYPMHSSVANEWGYRSYNFSVPNATTADYYCFFRFVQDNNKIPLRRVIIGLEPSAFPQYQGADARLVDCARVSPYLLSEDRVSNYSPSPNGNDDIAIRTSALLDRQRRYTQPIPFYTYEQETGDQVPLTDRPVDIAQRTRKNWQRQEEPTSYNNTMMMMYGKQAGFHMQHFRYLALLIALCTAQDIKVSLFHPPLHRSVRDFTTHETFFNQLRIELFSQLAKHFPHTPVYDFLIPNAFGGSEDDFSDAGHMLAYNADTIVRSILGQTQ